VSSGTLLAVDVLTRWSLFLNFCLVGWIHRACYPWSTWMLFNRTLGEAIFCGLIFIALITRFLSSWIVWFDSSIKSLVCCTFIYLFFFFKYVEVNIFLNPVSNGFGEILFVFVFGYLHILYIILLYIIIIIICCWAFLSR
jgi:hypothetical protein